MIAKALAPAALAPVALIGGWTWAASRQPSGYDATRDTISALAARGAHDRWIMTLGLAVLGVCHLGSAAGLTGAGRTARLLLALGGAATLAVAALPQPSAGHVPAATVGFVVLALWPAATPCRRVGIPVAVVLCGLLVWLGFELDGELLGLSERMLAGAQSLCPLGFALGARRR